MTQDFAKIRPEPLLERKPVAAPPAWSLMLTGVVVGITIGVFASFLVYLSGKLPPMNTAQASANNSSAATTTNNNTANFQEQEPEPDQLDFDFYTALPNYEVIVDATPVTLREPEPKQDAPLTVSYMLQTGAFQLPEGANQEMRRQQSLGLDVRVKQESTLPGRTLFLVQSGPYLTQSELTAAEQILRRNNIQYLKTAPR